MVKGKKKWFLILIIVFLASILIFLEYNIGIKTIIRAELTAIKRRDLEKKCEQIGGRLITDQFRFDVFYCAKVYKDEGKPCKSSDECEGDCMITNKSQTIGKCQTDNYDSGRCNGTIEEKRIICI